MKFILNKGKLYSYLDLESFDTMMNNRMAYYWRRGGTVVEYELQDGILLIPDGVEVLDSGVFPNNNHITELYLPNSVTRLEGGAFCNLDDVKKLHLPPSIKSIDVFDMRYLEQCMRAGCRGNFCAFGHCDEYATFYCEKGSFVDTYCKHFMLRVINE